MILLPIPAACEVNVGLQYVVYSFILTAVTDFKVNVDWNNLLNGQ